MAVAINPASILLPGRARSIRGLCSSSPVAGSLATEEEQRQQRRALKDALAERLDDSKGNLDEESLRLISSLEVLSPLVDLSQVPHLYRGCFQGLRASFKNSGRKGEVQKEVGFSGAVVTLGRATFNVYKPTSLEIVLGTTYNHVGFTGEDDYSLIIQFRVAGRDDLEGMLVNRARFSISAPKRMDVLFLSSTMKPRFSRDLGAWIDFFRRDNASISEEDGSVDATLPAAKGWLDYLYLDEEIRITRGNRGGVSVVQRLDEPVINI